LGADERRAFFREVVVMAPMATGGNLPYRRLCTTFGARITCSEMILADKLVKGGERPLLRRHDSEQAFGVQYTGKNDEVMAEAARISVEHGARFIDLNFGCPIDLIVRRGQGAALLKKPSKIGRIVAAVRAAVDVPLSVKLRLGYSEDRINCLDTARAAVDAGADAIGLHGRTRAQRYRLSARWDEIDRVQQALEVPVLGNGDILTPWDLERRRRETAVRSFLVARGALIKPWIFRELAEGRPWNPTVAERWAVMRRYLEFAQEYFGDDEKGMVRVERFFLWHLGFWHRWRAYTEADFAAQLPDSLIQARAPQVDGDGDDALLASEAEADHAVIFRRVLAGDYPAA
jgi:tRNA-dihydrouridine synthase 3